MNRTTDHNAVPCVQDIARWLDDTQKKLGQARNVKAFSRAFFLRPYGENVKLEDYALEAMLWHVVLGDAFQNPYRNRSATTAERTELDGAIKLAKSQDFSTLADALMKASGIGKKRLDEMISSVKKDEEDVVKHLIEGKNVSEPAARAFLALVHAPELQLNPALAQRQNEAMVAIFTGKAQGQEVPVPQPAVNGNPSPTMTAGGVPKTSGPAAPSTAAARR